MKMIKTKFLLSKSSQKKSTHLYIIYDVLIKSLYSIYKNIYFRLGVFPMENKKIGGIEEMLIK